MEAVQPDSTVLQQTATLNDKVEQIASYSTGL